MLDFGFYNLDCMEGMKDFPDNFFELAIVDPPYGDASENRGGVEQVRAAVQQVQESTSNQRTVGNQTAHGVIRIGGTWARKYRKKLFRGTLPQIKRILMSFFVSHVTRLSGGATILIYRPQDVF